MSFLPHLRSCRLVALLLPCGIAACEGTGTLESPARPASQASGAEGAPRADGRPVDAFGSRPDALRGSPASDVADAANRPAPPTEASVGVDVSDARAESAPDVPRPPDVPAAPTQPPPPLVVAVISDLNGSYGDATYERPVHVAVQRIIDARPDLVLCAGDMVAGQQAGLDYAAMWRGFHAAVSDPLANAGIPLAVSPGNHDASAYGGFEAERRVFAAEWAARRPAVEFTDDADYPFRYAFTLGEALFVSLDDTLIGPMRAADRDWVGARVAERADLQVKVVFGHVPIHPFTEGRETEILDDRPLEDLLIDASVSLFISGHHHGFFPGRHRGLRQVSMPCLGSGARPLIGTDGASPRGLVFFRIEAGPEGARITQLDGYGGPEMNTVVDRAALPQRIGVVTRDDL